MHFSAVAVIGLDYVALRVVGSGCGDDQPLGANQLRHLCPLGQRAGLMIVGPHNQVGGLLELLVFSWFLAKSVFHDLEIEAERLAVGDLSEVGVEVGDGVVREVSDEGTGNDERGVRGCQDGEQCNKSYHIMECADITQQYTLRMEALINSLLRPYRSTYTPLDLGKKRTDGYSRTDATLLNDRDQLLQYSYYQNARQSDVCVVYCHCNSGSRIQGVQYLEQLVEKGWNVCLFDFSGSGQSQGNHISLGHYEARDLDCMVRKMRGLGNRRFLLWGRSMGAATIIFYLNESKFRDDIIACVLDSPYASLWSLVKQIGKDRSMLPGFIIERVLDYLRDRIKQQHLFDIKQLEPLKHVGSIDQPILFITSLMDECVKSEDVVQLYKASSSRIKQLEYIDKPHNSARDKQTIDLAINFLYRNLTDRNKKKKQMTIFVKNNKDLTGANMADLIVRAEREKTQIRRMKSEQNIDRSTKENKDRVNIHMKTELMSTHSVVLGNKSKISPDVSRKGTDKRKTIKFSLAHIEQKKLAEVKNMTINPYKH